MTRPSSARRGPSRAVDAYRTAADCIGPVIPGFGGPPGSGVFAVTRGQFSMSDAIFHVLDQLGPSKVSLWTWTTAASGAESFRTLLREGRITEGLLVVDADIRRKTQGGSRNGRADDLDSVGMLILSDWQAAFGPQSVKMCNNHAKIATVEGGGMKVLIRGSMNLNNNPRFEQLDLTEGGEDFDLVRQIEEEMETLPLTASAAEAARVSGVTGRTPREIANSPFAGISMWRP